MERLRRDHGRGINYCLGDVRGRRPRPDQQPLRPIPGGITSIPGVAMCEHFNGPIAPPDQSYVATATVSVPTSPVPEQSTTIVFTIAHGELRSHTGERPRAARWSERPARPRVRSRLMTDSCRPAPVALVTVERLDGATWVAVGQAMSANDGSFVVTADRLLAAGTYIRFLYPGDYWVAPYRGGPWAAAAAWSPLTAPPLPVVTQPTAKGEHQGGQRTVQAEGRRQPEQGHEVLTFQVQRKNADWIVEADEDLPD